MFGGLEIMFEYFMSEQEKARAEEIKSKMHREPVSLDDLKLLIRYLKHDIELLELRLANLDKKIARDNFDSLNHNDYSFWGFITKGARALSTGVKHMNTGAIKLNISTTKKLIETYEEMLHEWESDPEAKKRHDSVFEIIEQMHSRRRRFFK